MKRALLVGAALLALALGFLAAAAAAVDGTAEQVAYTETVLYGSRAAAEGLRVDVRADCDRYLFWDTSLSFGADAVTAGTDFRFRSTQEPIEWTHEITGLSLWADLYGGMGFSQGHTPEELRSMAEEDPAQQHMLPLWLDAAAQTPAGERSTVRLRLSDYYAFYPLEHSADLGRVSGSAWYNNREAVQQFFRIPVPETLQLDITVEKDAEGRITDLSSNPAAGLPIADFCGVSAVTEKYCFFAFCDFCSPNGWAYMDLRNVPGGRGVYRFPHACDEYGGENYDASQLETVFPLPDDEPVLALTADSEGHPLLVTAADGSLMLTVLDPEGRTALQRTELGPPPPPKTDGYGCLLSVYDGWMVFEYQSSRRECGDLAVAARGADGLWQAVLYAPCEQSDACWPEGLTTCGDRAFAWDGSRLAVVQSAYDRNSGGSSGSFFAEVFDADGLQYFARLDGSLGVPSANGSRPVSAAERDTRFGGFRARFS